MTERLVLGSKNPGKLNEWIKFFSEFGIEVGSLSEFRPIPNPIEDFDTFIENARAKASWYAKLTGRLVFADDGGYEIDYLNGWPGVRSRRILAGGKEGTDKDLIKIVLERMKGVPIDKRTVRLTSAVALSDVNGNIIFEDITSSSGIIAEKAGPILIPGYPFRSIHFLPELGKTYAELSEKEITAHSHKRPVAKKLAKFLETL